jgi:hypothetical protein
MGMLVRLIKFLVRSYQRTIDGSRSAQIAYQILQRGLRRWEESKSLLNPRELSLIQSCRNHLILSAAERELIKDSEEAVSRRWLQNARVVMAMAGVLVLLIAGAFVVFSTNFGEWEEKEGAVLVKDHENGQVDDIAALKVNQPPRKEPLFPEPAASDIAGPESADLPAAVEEAPREPTPPPSFPDLEPAGKTVPLAEGKVVTPPAPEPVVPEKPAEKKATNIKPLTETTPGSVQIRRQGGKAGIADAAGRFLIKPEYDDIQPFNRERGLFKVIKDGKEGLAQAQGELLLHPFFEEISDYIQPVQLIIVANNGKYGFYDEKRRRFSGGFDFLKICCYSEGLFGVQRDNGRWGFVDREGKAVILSMFEGIEKPFRNGRAVVLKDGKKVQIDRNGNVFPL